jgi:hypothetical protein
MVVATTIHNRNREVRRALGSDQGHPVAIGDRLTTISLDRRTPARRGFVAGSTTDRHGESSATFNSIVPQSGSNDEVQVISHGKELPFSDENRTWQLRFQCFEEYAVVNWHFNFASLVRIATDRGNRRRASLAAQRRGATGSSPHFVPLDYTLGGTMKRVHIGDILDHQDSITFPQ